MELTEDVKRKIREHLKKMREHFTEVHKAIRAGDNKKAADLIRDIADEKHLALSLMPDIPLSDKVTLPFNVIYDVFSEIDRLLENTYWEFAYTREIPKGAIGKLSELIDELLVNILRKYMKESSDAMDQIEQLIRSLLNVLKKMKHKTIDVTVLEDEDIDKAERTKEKFLNVVGGEIKLFDIYYCFENMDAALKETFKGLFPKGSLNAYAGDPDDITLGPKTADEVREGWIRWVKSQCEGQQARLEKFFE